MFLSNILEYKNRLSLSEVRFDSRTGEKRAFGSFKI